MTRPAPRPFARAATLVAVAALAASSAARAADETAPAVRVASVELPAKKDGGRDLRHALGNAPEEAAATALAAGLRGTSLVRAVEQGEPADFELRLVVEKASTRPDDRSDAGATTSLIEVATTVRWDWLREGVSVQTGRLDRQRLEEIPGRIGSRDLTLAWEDLLAEIGAAVVVEGSASGAFRPNNEGGRARPAETGSRLDSARPNEEG